MSFRSATQTKDRRRYFMNVLARLDQTRSTHDILEHPFYQRWSAGQLSAEELGCYAGEYRHAARALAGPAGGGGRGAPAEHAADLQAHAAEEAGHVALWEEFARTTVAPPA